MCDDGPRSPPTPEELGQDVSDPKSSKPSDTPSKTATLVSTSPATTAEVSTDGCPREDDECSDEDNPSDVSDPKTNLEIPSTLASSPATTTGTESPAEVSTEGFPLEDDDCSNDNPSDVSDSKTNLEIPSKTATLVSTSPATTAEVSTEPPAEVSTDGCPALEEDECSDEDNPSDVSDPKTNLEFPSKTLSSPATTAGTEPPAEVSTEGFPQEEDECSNDNPSDVSDSKTNLEIPSKTPPVVSSSSARTAETGPSAETPFEGCPPSPEELGFSQDVSDPKSKPSDTPSKTVVSFPVTTADYTEPPVEASTEGFPALEDDECSNDNPSDVSDSKTNLKIPTSKTPSMGSPAMTAETGPPAETPLERFSPDDCDDDNSSIASQEVPLDSEAVYKLPPGQSAGDVEGRETASAGNRFQNELSSEALWGCNESDLYGFAHLLAPQKRERGPPVRPCYLLDGSIALDEEGNLRWPTNIEKNALKKARRRQDDRVRWRLDTIPGPKPTPDDKQAFRESLMQKRIMREMDARKWTDSNRHYIPHSGTGWTMRIEELEEHDPDIWSIAEKRMMSFGAG